MPRVQADSEAEATVETAAGVPESEHGYGEVGRGNIEGGIVVPVLENAPYVTVQPVALLPAAAHDPCTVNAVVEAEDELNEDGYVNILPDTIPRGPEMSESKGGPRFP